MAGLFKAIGATMDAVCTTACTVSSIIEKTAPSLITSAEAAAATLELNALKAYDDQLTQLGGLSQVKVMQQSLSQLHK